MLVFNLVFTNTSYSQIQLNQLLDSLDRTGDDHSRVFLYKDLGRLYYMSDIDSAIYYAQIGLSLAEKIEFEKGAADLNNDLGNFFNKKGLNTIAVDYYFASLELKEKLGDEKGIASTQNNLGTVYNNMDEPDNALKYYLGSIEYYIGINDTAQLATLYMNIGNSYLRKKMNEEALVWYFKSKPIFEQIGDSGDLHKISLNIGEYYENKMVFDSARQYYENAVQIGISARNDDWYSRGCIYLGRLLLYNGYKNQAKKYLSDAFELGREVKSLETLRDASLLLRNYYDSVGYFDSAFYYSKQYNRYSDSLNYNELNRQLGIEETKYEYQIFLKESEHQVSRQRFLRNMMFLFFGLAVLLIIYIYRSYRNKQKANRLLAEMDELKSRLFSNISHEFRTPLTLILGPLEQMMELEKDKKPSKKIVQMMQRNANRLLDLVNQMLDLSKVDAGSMKLELVEEELFKALRVMILSFASLAEKKKIDFTFDLPVRKLVTWFDPDKLEKIVNNLLSNAFKFTPEEGKVKVEVRIETPDSSQLKLNRLFITIEDSGKGIPKEELEHIFDRFHRAEGAAEIETVGTGIGLALTKELVEVMHGEISVESQEGKGTKFSLELPVGKDHLNESEYVMKESDDTKSDPKSSETETIAKEEECEEEICNDEESGLGFPMVLTVEDHEDIRTHIRENLEDCFRVMEAENGKSGLEKAIENVPDLIITDLMMPEMDGIELCKHLKTDERTSHIPVIMLTAKASVEDKLEGLETGADAYVTKPFNIKEVRLRVTKLIEQRNKLRERFSKEITLEPKDIAVTSTDERFLQKAMTSVDEHMGDSDFDVRQFQEEMLMSRMQLFRKLKALTNHTPSEFIRNLRLKRAAKLIEGDFGNVAEVCYEVGFNNLSYFAKCFKELFKVLPSEYTKSKKE